MENVLQTMQDAVRRLCPGSGSAPTGIAPLTAYRDTSGSLQMPQRNTPYLYLVLDGMLRLYTPSGILDYGPGQYSISQIDTPLSGTVLAFSEHRDFLALALEFTANDVIAAVLETDNDLIDKITGEALAEQEMLRSDRALIQTVCRLLLLKEQALPSEFLQKNIIREII